MKNKWLIWGAVAVGAYLVWKKMNKSNPTGRELAPPPSNINKPPVSPRPLPSVTESENTITEEGI